MYLQERLYSLVLYHGPGLWLGAVELVLNLPLIIKEPTPFTLAVSPVSMREHQNQLETVNQLIAFCYNYILTNYI